MQLDRIRARDGVTQEEAVKKLLSAKQPSGEFVTPTQLGEVTVFLCSSSASQITGF
jgi:3-hydroxybutyrate dehydrogenase